MKDKGEGRFGEYELRVVAHEPIIEGKVIGPEGDVIGEVTVMFVDHPDAPPATDRYRLDPKKQKKLSPAAMAKGAARILQAEMGIGAATPEVERERKRICISNECGRYDFGRCQNGGCGCFLEPKVKIAKEHCPEGLW